MCKPKLGICLPRVLGEVGGLTDRKLDPTVCLAEDARTRMLGRCAVIVLEVIPCASLWLVYPRLGLVLVVVPSVEGGSSVHVGANPLKDGLGLVATLGVGRLEVTYRGHLL